MNQKQYQSNFIGLSSTGQEINKILQSRLSTIDKVISNENSRMKKSEVSEIYVKEVSQHCSQYGPIKRKVQEMISNEQFFKSINEKSLEFWSTNEKIEKDLEKRLQILKLIDSKIEDMIDKEIAMANSIEEIEEKIRLILNKKEHDHIKKAEPLYTKKESHISKLQEMKREKEAVKVQKLEELTRILEILKQMKYLRAGRLEECKQTAANKDSVILLECLAKDIEQFVENKKLFEKNANAESKILSSLEESKNKIIRLSKELAETFELQEKYLSQLTDLRTNRSEIECFNSKFIGYFDIDEQAMLEVSQKFSTFIENESQKGLELKQVTQGIQTTEDTIEIFENLKYNLETETIRKNQLIERINNLSRVYSSERQKRETINSKEVKVQSMKINHSKLLSELEEAAEEADVKQYKIIHSQINDFERQISSELNDLERLKAQKRESSKKIFTETNMIQEEFRDLISEILPQIWLRDHDFNKEETIADFEVYLTKLFSRLKILA